LGDECRGKSKKQRPKSQTSKKDRLVSASRCYQLIIICPGPFPRRGVGFSQ
jgi:prophage antirepressor-like protein